MKKAPNHVMIGGQKFRIIVGTLENGDFGRMYFDERKIVISTACLSKSSILRETLRHEVLHAALHVSGVSFLERYEEETVVRAIENIYFPAWDGIKAKL
jgi:Zn-dependent peptidase ImmA (M78 family)